MFSSYRKLKLAIVLYQANNAGGAWRSIMTYYRAAEMKGDAVRMINRSNRRTFRQIVAAAIASPRLLLNGLDSFHRWEAIVLCFLRRDTLIYLHETAYMLDRFQRTTPFRYRLVKRILGRNPILAVSNQAAGLYRKRFGSEKVFVVYECLPPRAGVSISSDRKNICMVGSVDERKGASFFSELADRARDENLPWDFHWIGGKGSQESCYLSENVKWWGWLDNPRELVKRCDLFFLASVDDPFPLSCLEALQDGVRTVAYAGTGVSEVLKNLTGCAVFEEYTISAAHEAINAALAMELIPAEIDCLMCEQIEVGAFRERMERVFSAAPEQHGPVENQDTPFCSIRNGAGSQQANRVDAKESRRSQTAEPETTIADHLDYRS